MFILSLSLLLALIILQIFYRPFIEKKINLFLIAIPILIAGVGLYYSTSQYLLWQSVEPSKYLLPPYTPISYFIRYSMVRFFAPHIISLIFAVVFFAVARFMNKRTEERFFEREEISLASIALFLSGFPGILFVFSFIIAVYLLIHLANFFFKRKIEVIPVYYLWLPGALFAIIITTIWLSRLNFWTLLKIS